MLLGIISHSSCIQYPIRLQVSENNPFVILSGRTYLHGGILSLSVSDVLGLLLIGNQDNPRSISCICITDEA